MPSVGVVGHGSDKFTEKGEKAAKEIIEAILKERTDWIFVSGASPMKGIDFWAEEAAKRLGMKLDIKAPKQHSWEGSYGFKARNIDIAKSSDELYVVLSNSYPPNYLGKRYDLCYHDDRTDHPKSGACWTAKRFRELHNREAIYIIVEN